MAESTTFISRKCFDIEVEINQQELEDLSVSELSDLLWNVEEEVEIICESDLDDVFEQFEDEFILETLPSIAIIPADDLSPLSPNNSSTADISTNVSTTPQATILYTCDKCQDLQKKGIF